MTTSFTALGVPDALTRSLTARGITEPFPIQTATLPEALAGRDVSGKAPTGSGKTIAFGLATLARVPQASRNRPRALVLAPTRELAQQITDELGPLGKAVGRSVFAVYGGVGYGPQKSALRRGVDVLVATPGRLEDLIEQRIVDLRDVEIAVVDEADRMADMGFLPAVRRILGATSSDRQTLLFSATLDGEVRALVREHQRSPVRHEAEGADGEPAQATHHFWLVDHHDRIDRTAEIVGESTIVFTRTRHGADRLAKQLAKRGVDAVSMHGGRSQKQRTRALDAFSSGRARALIATDVAARGIHVDDVATVVHFDPPNDAKDYVHRSGRTARAGATGTVISLVTPEQKRSVNRMRRDLGFEGSLDRPDPGGVRRPDRPAPARPTDRRTSIYVANLPWSTTADELERVFAGHGPVHDATIITDRRGNRSRGFGFVEMAEADAARAISELAGTSLGGRDLVVRPAKPRT